MTWRHRAFELLGRALAPAGIAVGKLDETTGVRRRAFMADAGITLVLDVGAATGAYGTALRAAGYAGRIVSYEPLASSSVVLRQVAEPDPRWEVRPVALGATAGTATLHVAANGDSSSVLPMLDRHVDAAPYARPVGEQQITMTTLDEQRELLRPGDGLMVKLDVQGNEAAALAGGEALLPEVRLLELELSLVPLYEGGPLWTEVIDLVAGHGLRCIWLEREFLDLDGRVLQVNGIFART